ncbi:MAG: DNA (cytosine-5-)-methyltransferase [Chloroflexi bacterium]|nr:DNA (cytosine-5-)-methyltransferase [Chloroflexota bacterium]
MPLTDAPTFDSHFAGCGGIDLGLERAGWTCAFQCEIDRQARGVLERHWPETPRWDDITTLRGEDVRRLKGTDRPATLMAGGFPCQDLSVAGRRDGLDGKRSRLFYEFDRLLTEIAPECLLLENVPGLLSSRRGADFAALLGHLTGFWPTVPRDGWRNAGVCFGPRYNVAWRVLDAQFIGVAQRRRRVFLVGHLRDRTFAARCLFEPEALPGDSPPRPGQRQEVAAAGEAVAAPSGRVAGPGGFAIPLLEVDGRLGAGTLSDGLGVGAPRKSPTWAAAFTERGITNPQEHSWIETGRPSPTLHSKGMHVIHDVAQPLRANRWGGSDSHGDQGDLVISIGGGSHPLWAYDLAQPLLNRRGDPGMVISIAGDSHPVFANDLAAPLVAEHGQNGMVLRGITVRELTMIERERLQAMPDNWTAFDAKGKRLSKTARQRLTGNSVATTVITWLGLRMKRVLGEIHAVAALPVAR